MFNKENFLGASFTGEGKTYVEVLYKHEDGKTHPFVIDINDVDHPNTKELFNIIDLETIEMMTAQRIREERESFEKMVMGIAKREGLIPENTVEVSKDSNYISLDSLVFEWDEDNEEQKEALFQLKLKMFDMGHIQDSKKKTAKTALRKSQTPLDALVAYSKF